MGATEGKETMPSTDVPAPKSELAPQRAAARPATRCVLQGGLFMAADVRYMCRPRQRGRLAQVSSLKRATTSSEATTRGSSVSSRPTSRASTPRGSLYGELPGPGEEAGSPNPLAALRQAPLTPPRRPLEARRMTASVGTSAQASLGLEGCDLVRPSTPPPAPGVLSQRSPPGSRAKARMQGRRPQEALAANGGGAWCPPPHPKAPDPPGHVPAGVESWSNAQKC